MINILKHVNVIGITNQLISKETELIQTLEVAPVYF